jgi:hypothetical protein
MVPALLWPALANRFPLVFHDTGGYLVPLFEHELYLGRSALYGAFLALGIPTWLNAVHVPVFLPSLAALPILVGLSRRRVRRRAAALALFVFFALLGNAAICGAMASAYDRYQSRLAALAPLAVAIAALGWRRAQSTSSLEIAEKIDV